MKTGLVIGVSGAIVGSLVGALVASAAAPPERVHEVPAGEHVEHSHGTETPEGPLHSALVAERIISDATGQRLVLEASASATADAVAVKRSVAVYDSSGRAWIPATRSSTLTLNKGDVQAQRYEVPAGLPDGFYYAELLTAYAEKGDSEPLLPASRLYFQVAQSELNLLTGEAWETLVNSQDTATSISEEKSR